MTGPGHRQVVVEVQGEGGRREGTWELGGQSVWERGSVCWRDLGQCGAQREDGRVDTVTYSRPHSVPAVWTRRRRGGDEGTGSSCETRGGVSVICHGTNPPSSQKSENTRH